jgi:hypothetical protein
LPRTPPSSRPQTFKEELKSSACRDKVHRKVMRAARDIRFDDVLANACQEDRKNFCNDVQPVGAGAPRGAWGRAWEPGCEMFCIGRG